MLVVDSQIHVWGADTPERPWPADGHTYAHGPDPVSAEEVLDAMAAADVAAAVLVPPSWEGERNDLALAAAETSPGTFRVGAKVRPELVHDRSALLALLDDPMVVALRLVYRPPRQRWVFEDDASRLLYEVAEERRTPIMLFAPTNVEGVVALARRHPRLPIAVDHLGLSDDVVRRLGLRGAIDRLAPLADFDNVVVKASTLPSFATDDGTPLDPVVVGVRAAVEMFGAGRVFWGSDLTRLPVDYASYVRFCAEGLDFLDAGERDLFMGQGLCDWLGWQPETA